MAVEEENGPLVTVIVPTMNESGNIEPLVSRVGRAMRGLAFELLFVDDSVDRTPEVIRTAAGQAPFPIRLIARPVERRNGLSGAVVEGLAAMRGSWACVMDGDLQHPPELIPQLLDTARKVDADMVVASRRASALGPQGLSFYRTVTSQSLTILARALFPRSLKDVSDPLTGFFLVRRERVNLERLAPEGFKILLEILVRCPHMRITELLFDFGERGAGESKANVREGIRFFRHLWHLRLTAHQRPMGRYLAVAAASFVLNNLIFLGLAAAAGLHPLLAAAAATEISDLWNFWGNLRFVFHGDAEADRRFGRYFAINQLFLFLLRLPILAVLIDWAAVGLLPANILAIALTAAVRYLLSDRWIWTRDLVAHERPNFTYDLHGIVAVESPIPLPMLAWFQVERLDRPADLRIRVDRHGTPRPVRQAVVYDEGLGRLGFAVSVQPGPAYAEVIVSPLVQRSPFVLYNNIVEPLLRWLFLRHRAVLVQAGGIVDQGDRVRLLTHPHRPVISAAVLAALAEQPDPAWLGHDLVVLTAAGEVLAFPKPLTLVKRLESPWIRRLGAWLRRMHLPVATVNSLVQGLIPPRQSLVSDLLPRAEVCAAGRPARLDRLDPAALPEDPVDALIASGRDPYGFPLLARLIAQTGEPPLEAQEAGVLRQVWPSAAEEQ